MPELHDLIGKAFEEKYEEYEQKAANGEMDQYKSIPAKELGEAASSTTAPVEIKI